MIDSKHYCYHPTPLVPLVSITILSPNSFTFYPFVVQSNMKNFLFDNIFGAYLLSVSIIFIVALLEDTTEPISTTLIGSVVFGVAGVIPVIILGFFINIIGETINSLKNH